MKTEQYRDVREKYRIPEHYGRGWADSDGNVHFDFCDSTITVWLGGEATETHMWLGYSGHKFVTREWRP